MNKKKKIKLLIIAISLGLLLAALLIAVILDTRSPSPVLGIFQPETTVAAEGTDTDDTTGANADSSNSTAGPTDQPYVPTDDLPPSVTIPPEKDPDTGDDTISFPCQVPGYELTIEKMAPYSGMFVEDGTNADVTDVAMLLVSNNGDYPIEYTQIRIMCGEAEFLFDISALPAGEKLVVQEKNGKTITDVKAESATALVVRRADMSMSEGKVQVTDNGNNTLTIQNLTSETIPTVRVFYKYYMEDEDIFVGGIAFTVRVTQLGAGASVTIQPTHFTSQSSRVVMVLTYDTEV